VKAFAAYGAATAALLVALAMLAAAVFGSADPTGIRMAAVIAWPVQLAAFAALVRGRQGAGFMVSWVSGMALRFAAVGAAALWVVRADGPDPASLLVSLVGFVFVLVLLEPLFLQLTN